MRLYSFCNAYLSSLQQGLQTAHLTAELFLRYPSRMKAEGDLLYHWANNSKTIIILNGGNVCTIKNTFDIIWKNAELLHLPFGKFHEDDDSLGGIITCCGLVVPDWLYDATQKYIESDDFGYYSDGEYFEQDSPEWKLIDLIKSHHLAK